MALGGGTWVTQNKVMPGSYINIVSADKHSGTIGERCTTPYSFRSITTLRTIVSGTANE